MTFNHSLKIILFLVAMIATMVGAFGSMTWYSMEGIRADLKTVTVDHESRISKLEASNGT